MPIFAVDQSLLKGPADLGDWKPFAKGAPRPKKKKSSVKSNIDDSSKEEPAKTSKSKRKAAYAPDPFIADLGVNRKKRNQPKKKLPDLPPSDAEEAKTSDDDNMEVDADVEDDDMDIDADGEGGDGDDEDEAEGQREADVGDTTEEDSSEEEEAELDVDVGPDFKKLLKSTGLEPAGSGSESSLSNEEDSTGDDEIPTGKARSGGAEEGLSTKATFGNWFGLTARTTGAVGVSSGNLGASGSTSHKRSKSEDGGATASITASRNSNTDSSAHHRLEFQPPPTTAAAKRKKADAATVPRARLLDLGFE